MAMAKQGYKVFDSDMHIMEPPDLWQRYIAAAPPKAKRMPHDARAVPISGPNARQSRRETG